MWPIASIVGAPVLAAEYMMSDAQDTGPSRRLAEDSYVILCCRLVRSEVGAG